MAIEMTGRGDPARTLALLWRTAGRPARGPRPGLDLDRIVTAAVEIADADGLAGLSMRHVADRVGVGTMSLYTYLPGKAELVDLMLDSVYGETARPRHVPGGWRGALQQVAGENWALYHRHPWMLHIAVGRPLAGPNETAKYEYELRAVDGTGLTDVEMDAALRLVLGHVSAAARASLEKTQLEQQSGMTDAQWWREHAPLLETIVEGDFPVAARVATTIGETFGAAFDPGYAFEFGLARILDGIATQIGTGPAAVGDHRAMTDFEWDPQRYLALVAEEIPDYQRLQAALVEATGRVLAHRMLELGTGSGETARRVLAVHPHATLVGIDASEPMLAAAGQVLDPARVQLRPGRLEDPLPGGPFDLVFSALAVHHLDGPGKAGLFRRVRAALAAGGAFVLADLVVPEDPADVVTPVDGVIDQPSSVADQLRWLAEAGFTAEVHWQHRDLAVLFAVAD